MANVPDDLIDALIGREGEYSNNPADNGGETIWGITAATARAYGYSGAVKDMPRSTAVEVYRQRYWVVPRFDQVYSIDANLAEKLFDIGVNMGPATGVRYMQRALNVLNNQGKAFSDISVDGGIGPLTLAALNAFYAQRGAAGRDVLLNMIRAQQSVRYIELAEKTPSQEAFEYGWQVNRAFGV
ncbi:glycoside hydrolase family 108 protein [Paraburkholderia sp. MM6662-R1]|uniref:glycoside hydrolase family 108 protein n=1 Tax=Paraburkholderia sp. MM6662-R1 TaxID=2991066 RepID=UPI003D1B04B4